LEHTAGFDGINNRARYDDERLEVPSCADLVKVHKRSLYARWKPGVRMAYSNPGYILAGHLIEKKTNAPYSQFLKEEILQPIGMKSSGFFFKEPSKYSMATGHKREGGHVSAINFKSVLGGPASDFCSNAKEMSLFLKYLLSKKAINAQLPIFGSEWFERIENPKTTIASKHGFEGGYGLGNKTIWANNHLFHGHDGQIDGFSSIYLYSREADFGLTVSINSAGNVWRIVDEILLHFLGDNTFNDLGSKSISEETKRKFEGFYEFKNPRHQTMFFIQKLMSGHSIKFEEDKLLVQNFTGLVMDTLYHRGDQKFYRKDEGVPFAMLLEDENKTTILWLGNDYAEKENKAIRLIKNYSILGAVFFSLLCFLIGFILLLKRFFGKKKSYNTILFLWFSSFCFILFIASFLLTTEMYDRPEILNAGSILVFVSSIVFFISTLVSFIFSFKLSNEKTLFKLYYRLTAFSLLLLSIWLFSNGFIGLRLWAA